MSRIDIRCYRRFESHSERQFVGYDSEIVEELVRKVNELESRMQALEQQQSKRTKSSGYMIWVR